MKDNCPLKAGVYTIDGAYFPLKEAPRDAFQSGDYMTEIYFMRDGQDDPLSILRFYATIINIKSSG